MKAAIIQDYQAPIRIDTIDAPALMDDAVLVTVHAASINPIDDILRSGEMKAMMPLTFPHVMGYDVSGEVVAVGKDVTGLRIGDAVFARPNQDDAGAIAEVARVKASELARKPATLTHAQAASVPLAGLTAWQALVTRGQLKAGDNVLIHAGSGGVGTFAIQIARHIGAHIATTCSAEHADLVRRLGADEVIDYKTERFEDQLSGYDLVFDMVGGDTLARSFKVLKKGGRLVSIKGQDDADRAAAHGVHFAFFLMEPDGAMLGKLAALIDAGAITPVIGRTFPMAETAAAYAALHDGDAAGKIVVTIL